MGRHFRKHMNRALQQRRELRQLAHAGRLDTLLAKLYTHHEPEHALRVARRYGLHLEPHTALRVATHPRAFVFWFKRVKAPRKDALQHWLMDFAPRPLPRLDLTGEESEYIVRLASDRGQITRVLGILAARRIRSRSLLSRVLRASPYLAPLVIAHNRLRIRELARVLPPDLLEHFGLLRETARIHVRATLGFMPRDLIVLIAGYVA